MGFTTSQLKPRSEVEDRTIRTKESCRSSDTKQSSKRGDRSCRLHPRKRKKNNSFDLSCKDSSKSEIFAADRTREGQLLWRY